MSDSMRWLRWSASATCAAWLCSAAQAQQALDASRLYPITVQPKDAGTFNVNTRRWMSPARAAQQAATTYTIYNNTCTWTGGAFYTGTGSCETYIDEGEIPGPGNAHFIAEGGTGATHTNNVVMFQFAYCTNFAVPEIKIGFYDTLGGRCSGLVPPTGPSSPTLAEQACPAGITASGINPSGTAYYDVGGLGLPGATTPGGTGITCWVLNAFLGNSGFCIQSEGDGAWNNVPDLDRFNWSWEMDNVLMSGAAVSGLVISGDPATPGPVAFGGCTYNIPCNMDALTGAPCGTGRGADDGFWINIDGDKPDGTSNTGVSCVSAPTAGTNCYFFNGYPGNPFASFWMVLFANGDCSGVSPQVTDCQTAPTALQSCDSVASTVGLPSAANAAPFTVTFSALNAGVNATVFYGLSGAVSVPWSPQSRLCVKSPTQRLDGVPGASGSTGGTGSCNGSLSLDFNSVIQNAGWLGTPMAAGQRVDMQGWQRDPASPKHTNLTDALTFVVGL
jgi:hypothetical protein